MKFDFVWPCGFREDLLRWWTDDGRWLGGYTISSSCEPNGSNELKKNGVTCHTRKNIIMHICINWWSSKFITNHGYFNWMTTADAT